MRDISQKIETLRVAKAMSVIRMSEAGRAAIDSRSVPKGDVFEAAKIAAYMAAKKTSDAIPFCHPLPVEGVSVEFEENGLEIEISVEVKTAYKTGCEMEALHASSLAALTIYDMLKPIDGAIEICSTRLLEKTGGKSDFIDQFKRNLRAGVVVMSDSVASGKKEDRSGKVVMDRLSQMEIEVAKYTVIPDEIDQIRAEVEGLCAEGVDLVITSGGTGLSPRDVTPEAVQALIDTEIPGIMEAARVYGMQRTPYAMLSRGVAGLKGKTLIVTLPGSTRGASETMDALFPFLLHAFRILAGRRHN